MSKIDELIAKYCPNGVEFKELGEVCEIKTGQQVSKIEIQQNPGKFPVINSGREPLGFINRYNTENDPIGITTRGAGVGSITWCEGKYFRGNLNYSATIKNSKLLDVRFLFHILINSQLSIQKLATFNGIPALNKSNLEKLTIPIPPLPIQQEIVNILDKFTELEEELEKELEEELKARRKQYKYYRNQLLTPVEVDGKWLMNGVEVEWKTLGEVLDYEQPNKYIVKSTIYNDNHKTPVLTAGKSFILGYTNETEGIYKASKDNPVIIFDDFTTSFHWVDFDFKVKSSAMKILHPKKDAKVIFKFVYYEMRCILYSPQDHARQWISQYSKFKIPIPPISEQERIVEILDKFDSLVNDISIVLPAEIEARRKQYEYYRSKLLSFKPK
ncbi:MAG: restriction endonuclease subunit S [Bacteroidales bacterium]